MITLTNEYLKVDISEIGAEIKNVEYNNEKYIWEGKKEIWNDSSPLLFPICGGLKDDKCIIEGKEYSIPKHGFVRRAKFEIESFAKNTATFLFVSNEETKKMYPYDFELRVIYSLKEKSVVTEYAVKNNSGKNMYFSIGSHEAYFTPEGIEDYDIIFPEEETLSATVVCGTLLSHNKIPIIKNSTYLPLYDKYFLIDALVFENIKSKSVKLRNRKTEKCIKVDFPNAQHLLLWHKPSSPFLCIEPWSGIPDKIGSSYDFSQKEGIQVLEKDETYITSHTFTIE